MAQPGPPLYDGSDEDDVCLHLAADNSVVLTPFAGVDTHEEQQWEVSAKSVIYRGDDRSGEICLEAKH